MKTERRHELQTNWLADRVGECLLVIKPYMKAMVGVALAALVVWIAILYMAHRAAAEETAGWNLLWDGLLGGPNAKEDLATLSDSSPKRPPGEWASLILADDDLTSGVGSLFMDKTAGRDQIKSALENYKAVLNNSTDPLIREHALYGVGRAQESLCDLEAAETAYKQLRTDYPMGSYSTRAKERLDDLSRESTRDRYQWFAKIVPPPTAFGKGLDKTGDKTDSQFPPDTGPFSEFTNPLPKTPPPEPKPDKGAAAPKESKPSGAKTPGGKTPDTKAPPAKTPDTKAPDKSKSGDKTGAASPTIPKPTDAKASNTKATDKPVANPSTTGSTPPAPAATTPKPDASKIAPPKPANSKS